MQRKNLYKVIEIAIIFVGWFALDRLAKSIVSTYEVSSKITESFLGIFHITFIKNTGAAFGLFANNPIPLAVISIVISTVLLVCLIFMIFNNTDMVGYKINQAQIISICVISAGGLSNAFDRICFGYVIDYIDLDFMSWPVFNIADIGVTCGVILLVISMFWSFRKHENKKV